MTDGPMHSQDALMHKAMAWALRNAVVSKGNVLALITQLDESSTFQAWTYRRGYRNTLPNIRPDCNRVCLVYCSIERST